MSRTKKQYRTLSKANYHRFCNENPEIDITFKEFREILMEANRTMYIKVLETGEPIKAPHGFGTIGIHKYKPKYKHVLQDGREFIKLPVDWIKSREEGYLVYNMNFHTDGLRFKWKMNQRSVSLPEWLVWSFRPCRYMSRALAKYLKSDPHYSQLYNMK